MTESDGFSKLQKTEVWLFINHPTRFRGIDLMFPVQKMFRDYNI